jgi:hypothetical protein
MESELLKDETSDKEQEVSKIIIQALCSLENHKGQIHALFIAKNYLISKHEESMANLGKQLESHAVAIETLKKEI